MAQQQQQQQAQGRRRRKLTFDHRTRVYLIPTTGELSAAEFAALHRTADDDVATQAEVVRTIRAMGRHHFHDGDAVPQDDNQAQAQAQAQAPTQAPIRNDELTTRGLEHMRSSAHFQLRQRLKVLVNDVILAEQRRQHDAGRTAAESEEDVAAVSRSVTARNVEEALERAAGDAAYVRRAVAAELGHCQEVANGSIGTPHLVERSWAADLSQALAADDDNVTSTIPSTESVAASTTWRPTTSNSAILSDALSPSWPAGTGIGNTNTNVILNQMASNASVAMSNHKARASSLSGGCLRANS